MKLVFIFPIILYHKIEDYLVFKIHILHDYNGKKKKIQVFSHKKNSK